MRGLFFKEKGQSSIEVLFMIPVMLLILMGMYQLFCITFASSNAHIRAREFTLHCEYKGTTTVADDRGYTSCALESPTNYKLADDIVHNPPSATAGDTVNRTRITTTARLVFPSLFFF